MSEQYGEEAGSGGNITWIRGLLPMTASVQDYDLNAWAIRNNITGGIEIKRIFYEADPAIVRYFDPYAGTGTGMQQLLDNFGWGNYSPAINFLLMPINYDLQKIQAIEFNDQIRKSQFSFELVNNQLRIFPTPKLNRNLSIQYILKGDRLNAGMVSASNQVTNISNIPFTNPVYSQINSVGKQWIYEYVLAICKETLGLIRGKYQTVPIPNSEATLNYSDLLTDARSQKESLLAQLRETLDQTGRQKQLEKLAANSENLLKVLNDVPMGLYIF